MFYLSIFFYIYVGIVDDGLESDELIRDKHDQMRPKNPARPMAG